MGKNLNSVGILPTPYTQNFWVGCQPVSEGCAHCYARAACQEYERDPDPLITKRNSSLDGNAALRKPANTGCGAPDGSSGLAEIVHPLGAELLSCCSYAQTDQAFPYRIALAVRD